MTAARPPMMPTIPPKAAAQRLHAREIAILKMIADGLLDDEIAAAFARSRSAIRADIRAIKTELKVSRREVLVRFAVRAGLVAA